LSTPARHPGCPPAPALEPSFRSRGVGTTEGGRDGTAGLTSEVLDEVLQLHLALGLDAGAVHVGVEEDDGEGQDEDGVRVAELAQQGRVTHAVALAAGRTTPTGPWGQGAPWPSPRGRDGLCTPQQSQCGPGLLVCGAPPLMSS